MTSIEKQIKIVRRSPLFDKEWYLSKYTDVKKGGIDPASHYVLHGWKEGRDPSEKFKTTEYLMLNGDVKSAMICPLYHFEQYGRAEGRRARLDIDSGAKTLRDRMRDFTAVAKKSIADCPQRLHYQRLPINPHKILFATYQNKYVCNPKYICEELLRRDVPCEVVWLGENRESNDWDSEILKSVRWVNPGSSAAAYEIATSRVLIENGLLLFSQKLPKKKGQLNICTWHGSMGFKRIGVETTRSKRGQYVAQMYGKIHDVLLTNSQFEEDVFRNSFWPSAELWKVGHPRNDILFQREPDKIRQIRENVRRKLRIPQGYRFALYAPTFREKTDLMFEGGEINNCYGMNYQIVRAALKNRFGGDWVVLVRHHYRNMKNKVLHSMISTGAVPATEYTDMQELMVASDVGITDYSSWILDFLLTGKPGFLFASDEDVYSAERGFYYPLEEAPFPIAHNMDQLCKQIISFSPNVYQDKADKFLKEKGCVEDGNASGRVVDRIVEFLK